MSKLAVSERQRVERLAGILWTLLALFALRVAGQLAVAAGVGSAFAQALRRDKGVLPPMEQWQSGLLPYPALLASQLVILTVMTKVCFDFSRGRGYFVRPRPWLGTPLWIFGWIYAASMAVRYALWMTLRPEERWTGDLIPVVFHIVLAGFLLTVASHHRRTP